MSPTEILTTTPAVFDNAHVTPRRRTLRRVGAGLAGFVAIAVLSHATDGVLRAAGVFPAFGVPMSNALFGVALAYRTIYDVLGCYIAARFAPDRPMRNALALGIVGLVLSALGVVAALAKGPELGPIWYPIALLATTLPAAWLGGHLRTRQARA